MADNSTPCPGNPDALGISRVLTVSAQDFPKLGQMQYRQSLPLADHEVVLTFDDGPLPPYTGRVLKALAHECVKATFFIVGRMARAYPETLHEVAAAGHTIGNHSLDHPIHFDAITEARGEYEVEAGMRMIKAALGDAGTLAPFFRIPGLGRTRAIEQFTRERGLSIWSADTVADDWTRITSSQVLHRALSRLEARRKGILLLHDIQPRTVMMLPEFLTELKRRGFRIVHVVPAGAKPPAAPPANSPDIAVAKAPDTPPAKLPWPRVVSADPSHVPGLPVAMKAVQLAAETVAIASSQPEPPAVHPRKHVRLAHGKRKAVKTVAFIDIVDRYSVAIH